MPTIHATIQSATAQLSAAGVDNPPLDARLLVAHALNCDRLELLTNPEREISAAEQAAITTLINRRAAREPVARILGLREFWGLPFGLNEATLEPRPDSETLIETALQLALTPPRRLLDLGTGTGCLLLSLLHEWQSAMGLGLDIAPRAVEQAALNATRLGLDQRADFRVNNWLDGIDETFDLIISNPPYIASTDIPNLMPEVRQHDPMAALDGGEDGLNPYRHLIPQLPHYLNSYGMVVFEVGQHQAAAVAALLQQSGFHEIATHRDLGDIERCVSAVKV